MKRLLLSMLKYIAIAFGIQRLLISLILKFYVPSDLDAYNVLSDTSGVIGVMVAVLFFWIDRSDFVSEATNRKSKIKRVLLILITLGIIILVYRKAKREALI